MLISCNYKKSRINLIDHSFKRKSNVFSVLVGVNGVGKSRLLSGISINAACISKLPTSIQAERIQDVSKNLDPEYSKEFKRVIACSVSPFDKFPVVKGAEKTKGIYKYLGIRGIAAENIGFSHMSRIAIDMLERTRIDKGIYQSLSNTLSYLGYSENISFHFKLSIEFLNTGYDLLALINSLPGDAGYRSSYINQNDNLQEFLDQLLNERAKLERVLKENKYSKKEQDELRKAINHKGYEYFVINRILGLGFKSLKSFIKIQDKFYTITDFGIDIEGENLKFSDPNIQFRDLCVGFDGKQINPHIFNLKKIVLKKKNQKKSINISSASSGEQSILISLLGISTYIKNDSLILIDEPEICLHPSWQEKYIKLLSGCFSKLTGCHFIIATHSPQIISNLNSDDCYVINMTDNETYSSDEFLKRSADFQLANLFHAPGHKNEYLVKKISLILAELSSGNKNIDLEEVEDLFKLEKFLPENDPVINLISVLKKAISIIK